VTDAVADVMKPGDHGSTFAGNPLVCRAAEVVLDVRPCGRMHAGRCPAYDKRLACPRLPCRLSPLVKRVKVAAQAVTGSAWAPGRLAVCAGERGASAPREGGGGADRARAARRRSSPSPASWRAWPRAGSACARACARRWPATRTSRRSAGRASSAACSSTWCAPAACPGVMRLRNWGRL